MPGKPDGRKNRFIPEEEKRRILTDMIERAARMKAELEALGGLSHEVIIGSSSRSQSSAYLVDVGSPSQPGTISWDTAQKIREIEEKLYAALGALTPDIA